MILISPPLQRHQAHVNTLFIARFAKHRAKLRRTNHLPMACSAHDEVTTSGNQDVVHDLIVNKLGIAPEELDKRIEKGKGKGGEGGRSAQREKLADALSYALSRPSC